MISRPELAIGLTMIALLAHKIKIMRPAARGDITIAVLQHDAAIAALLLLLYSAALVFGRNNNQANSGTVSAILSKVCILVFLLIVVLYTADVAAYHFFVTRLYASDIVTFSGEPRSIVSLLQVSGHILGVKSLWKLAIGVALAFVLLRACYLLVVKTGQSSMPILPLLGTAVGLGIVWAIPVPDYVYSFVDRPLFENFIERNHNFYVRNAFSDQFRSHLLATAPPPLTCGKGKNLRVNVILLIVESLSAYQSHFFSGVEDWTPNLDRIATQETALPNFYANGWTTGGGLVSLLTGTYPLVRELRVSRTAGFTPIGGTALTNYLDTPHPLAKVLGQQGYTTEFVAPGDLGFLGQDVWLPAVGFQKVVDGNDRRFAGQRLRGPFNSVPDRLLLDVAFQESAQLSQSQPYFMTVQTFWSHRPFMDPNENGREHGQEPVFRDTDAQIGAFYDRLASSGFFKNGLLFITGDHRAMEPFQRAEFERFGSSAAARIPAVIATHAVALPRVILQDFQQRDFPASIQSLVSDQYCIGPEEGSFLSDPPAAPRCIIQARGDDRDLVFVKCGKQEGTVRAVGDGTRFISGSVPDEPSIISTINRSRVRPYN